MSLQSFLIAPFTEGIDTEYEPWLTPDKAFTKLKNVYLDRGIIKKRRGISDFGQLGTFVDDEAYDTGDGGKTYSHTLSNTPVIAGSLSITDVTGVKTVYIAKDGTVSGDGTATIDYDTGVSTVTFTAAVGVGNAVTCDYHYSETTADRVVRGVHLFDKSDGNIELIAFDKKRCSKWNTAYEYFDNISTAGGTYNNWNSANLIWTVAWWDYLWILDNDTSSTIFYYDGTNVTDAQASLVYNASGHTIDTALMAFPFYGRLVLLNTYENSIRKANRARWSAIGNPLATNAWRDDLAGQGGYVGASTNEEIVSAVLLRDRIIVYFERSVWALTYTGNPDLPFRWERLNSSFETHSTFGTMGFDDYVVSTGKYDLVACDGRNVTRFNKKIPDFTNTIKLDNIDKCYAQRSNLTKQYWLAYPDAEINTGENDSVLVYNYEYNNYSIYRFTDNDGADLEMNCLGKFEHRADVTFTDMDNGKYWEGIGPNATWGDYGSFTYRELAHQSGELILLSGSKDGRVFLMQDEHSNTDNSYDYDFEIVTKRFNPYVEQGRQVYVSYIDFLVTTYSDEDISVDIGLDFETGMTENIEETFECNGDATGEKCWKRVGVGCSASNVRVQLSYPETDILQGESSRKPFELHAIRLMMRPGGRLI